MAGDERLISVHEDVYPWRLVFDVADATPPRSWVLVGGLMVHVIAMSAQVAPPRPTNDIDLLLNIATAHVATVAGPLQALGFTPALPRGTEPVHRFFRDDDVIDVMVSTAHSGARWARRDIFAAPGLGRALRENDTYDVRSTTRQVRIPVPDPLGAIIAKSAAFTADQRHPERHLEDIVVLLAAAGGPSALPFNELTRRERQHLRRAWLDLRDEHQDAWTVIDEHDRVLGRRAFGAYRAD